MNKYEKTRKLRKLSRKPNGSWCITIPYDIIESTNMCEGDYIHVDVLAYNKITLTKVVFVEE